MTFSEAAAEVLRLVGRPMHFKKITQVAIAKNMLSHVGKTPEVTMSARLAAVVGKDKSDVPIVRTKAGIFALREWGNSAPNGTDVGENDSFSIPGEAQPEPKGKGRGKKAKAEPAAPAEDGKGKGRRGGRGRGGRSQRAATTEEAEVSTPSEEEAPAVETVTAESEAEPVFEQAPGAEKGEEEEELGGDGEEPSSIGGGRDSQPMAQVPGEGGGRRRRRRRRRRGGERSEGAGQGPIVEVRGRNGGGLPRLIQGGGVPSEPVTEEAAEPSGSGAYPVVGGAEPDEADLVGEVIAERDEDREKIQIPARGPEPQRQRERGETPREHDRRREVVTPRGEPSAEQTLADGAYRLLLGQERTGGVPIRQLAEQAMRSHLVPPDSPAPWMVVGAALRADIHKRALAGMRPRFRALSGSRWALFEWGVGGEALRLETEAAQIAERQREASRRTFLRRLVDMGDPQFEHLVLILVDRLGFDRPRRVNRGAGRELHLTAIHRHGPGGLGTALVFSRTGREIDPARVAELRGGLHHYDATVGWILTTGSVSAGAREEATATGAPPIGLTDSAALGRLFEDMGVGLCKSRVDLSYLDVELLDALKNG